MIRRSLNSHNVLSWHVYEAMSVLIRSCVCSIIVNVEVLNVRLIGDNDVPIGDNGDATMLTLTKRPFLSTYCTHWDIHEWCLAGHINRVKDDRWTLRVTTWRPYDKKRQQERPTKHYRDDMDKCWMDSIWQRTASDRLTWRRHADTFVKPWDTTAAQWWWWCSDDDATMTWRGWRLCDDECCVIAC